MKESFRFFGSHAAFSPDGKYLASGSDDNTVKIWWKGVISRQEFEEQERHRIKAEKKAERRRKEEEERGKLEAERRRKKEEERRKREAEEAERRRKEQELREHRLRNRLCLECGEKLGFMDKLSGAQYCKQHRG